jgi:hypothetical protein
MVSESGTRPIETMQDCLRSAGLKPLDPIWFPAALSPPAERRNRCMLAVLPMRAVYR